MRDPARIDRVLTLVAKVWKQHPDLRLAQLIGNCCSYDPYYLEDDKLETEIVAVYGPQNE